MLNLNDKNSRNGNIFEVTFKVKAQTPDIISIENKMTYISLSK